MIRIASLVAVLVAAPLTAQDPIWYTVDFPNAAHHEAEIEVLFPDLDEGTLELRMSRSSPGRYALHEFGKNVYRVRAADGMGDPLAVVRSDPYTWTIAHPEGDVRVTYTLFADYASGTYSGIDRSQAHLNMPATLMWARGTHDRPVRVDFRPPDGSAWRVATQLVPTESPFTFTAPDFHYLMDSPTHLGTFDVREWRVGSPSQTIRLAVDHEGTDDELDRFAQDVRAIVDATTGIWGRLPMFDFGTYTFIAAYLPWVHGDGMEHRNSTSLTSPSSIRANRIGLLGTVAHEFFHAWNVERIRPRSLEPFDFERANMSGALWFAEGFTSYYTNLILRRAGLIDSENYARRIGSAISTVVNSPGRLYRSPVGMSRHAPFVDRAVSIDPNNHGNTFISYYTWGSVVALGLDLSLRTRFPPLSLDAYMQELWDRFGATETPYRIADLERVLAEVTGSEAFAAEFFQLHVQGRAVPDFEGLLSEAGMTLRPADADEPWVGPLTLSPRSNGAVVSSYTLVETPLYEAGIDRGDRIVSVNGDAVGSQSDWDRLLVESEPGDELVIRTWSRGQELEATVTVDSSPRLEVVLFEQEAREVTAAARALRASWLEGND